jgi:splicing factor 3B subunit 4
LNGQYIGGKAIYVSYAYKKDGKEEKYGSVAERRLVAMGKKNNVFNTGFLPDLVNAFPPGFAQAVRGGLQMPSSNLNFGYLGIESSRL